MTMGDVAQLELSTDDLPAYRPDEFAREFFGKLGQRMELEPARDAPIRIQVTALPLSTGVVAGSGAISAMTSHRTNAMRSDGNSDLLICFPAQRMLVREQGGAEHLAVPGQAILGSLDRPVSFVSPEARNQFVTLQVSRKALSPYAASLDDHAVGVSAPGDPRYRLLRDYAASLGPDTLALPRLRDLAARHLLELTALAVGATADSRDAALHGGLRAARLAQATSAIMAHLEQPGLCAAFVAKRIGVSERYLRKLFETEPETFAEFVTARRLERAMAMLSDPARRHRQILDIAFSLGFGDVRTFNRAFRARFGRTPSDVRAARDQA
ncbi:MAG: helix-turn-helix transcriptional regulator [Phenylobacterium sp.]|uniref:AraC family transcriptional regulator n=1 Tax=Phenylobacterium sp. TaxID=1871053 RepID=UPI001A1A7B9A|nr:AraC family transcriptional regulator [Phenylobacterium sp.]MBJ7408842.1 helix-turn-helix transcriptional regulator [Phenylobacterium sp.]